MATKVKKLRVKKHRVVLNRSAGGDTAITVFMVILGVLMFLPMYLTVITAFKPVAELSIVPPKFYVMRPTLKNFIDLFTNMNQTWVPVSRYVFNTVYISVASTFGALVLGSMTAYALSRIRMPGYKLINNLIKYSLKLYRVAFSSFPSSFHVWIFFIISGSQFSKVFESSCTSLFMVMGFKKFVIAFALPMVI